MMSVGMSEAEFSNEEILDFGIGIMDSILFGLSGSEKEEQFECNSNLT